MSFRLFFDAEEVRSVRDPLAKLVRVIFNKRKITTNDFVSFHGRYWNHWNRGGRHESESTHRNNQRRTLLSDTISWKKALWIISGLLRLDFEELAVRVRDPTTGESIWYSTADTPIEGTPATEPDPDEFFPFP
jgi:hypothetical protein